MSLRKNMFARLAELSTLAEKVTCGGPMHSIAHTRNPLADSSRQMTWMFRASGPGYVDDC